MSPLIRAINSRVVVEISQDATGGFSTWLYYLLWSTAPSGVTKIKAMSARYTGTHQTETHATAKVVKPTSTTNAKPTPVAFGR